MSHLHPVDTETTYERDDDDEVIVRGRRPMSFSNVVGLVLLLAAFAFYLFFALPEFFGIVGQMP